MTDHFVARAPGRVNLIGDHTDYTGGLVLPMAIDRWTVVEGSIHDGPIDLVSDDQPLPVSLTLPVTDPEAVEPPWGRYVAGVAAEMGAKAHSIRGHVSTTIPVGAGLSSSAALELACALALGFQGNAIELAQLGRRAEHRASGVPCGIMDQLCIAAGIAGHALLIDCNELTIEPLKLIDGVTVVVQFVTRRALVGSAYADRVGECAAAEQRIGPLRLATTQDVARIDHPIIRRRAHHVVTENQRVRDFAQVMRDGDPVTAGRLMVESHNSLRDNFATSNPTMDRAVAQMCAIPGVYGARMTGGGFGGCIVAITKPGTVCQGWVVQAVDGASIKIQGVPH